MTDTALPDYNTFTNQILCKAAQDGRFEDAQTALMMGASPNAVDNHGLSALHYAAQHGWTDIISLLIEKGANPRMEGPNGAMPIHMAALGGSLPAYLLLAKHHDTPLPADGKGHPLFHYAAMQMRPPELKGATQTPPEPDFPALIHHLIGLGADINETDADSQTALHALADNGRYEACMFLAGLGANTGLADKIGETCLHWAAKGTDFRHTQILQCLVKRSTQEMIDAKNNKGETSLHLAVQHDSCMNAQMLLAHGANRNLADQDGKPAKHYIKSLAMAKLFTSELPAPAPVSKT